MAGNSAELQVLQGNSQFTTNLYKLWSEKSGNVFFSPISVHAALSMVYQGAQGTTSELLASALHVPEAKTAGEGYNEIIKRLNSVKNVTLLMANKVFLMDGCKLLNDFATAVTKNFLSEVQLVNFAQNDAAAKTINAWVEEKTHEKIKDFIQKDDLDALTRLVLVNAIYFKGNWKHKFNKKHTKTELFYLNNVDTEAVAAPQRRQGRLTVDVQMMHMKNEFNYKIDEALDAQILELPYTNEDLSMIIILPKKRNDIADLEKKLTTANLTEITQGLRNTELNVALPRFKTEQTIDLKDALFKLGLAEIYDPYKANFRGMIELKPDENLYVSKAVQKAFIEVNEEGAEAAAATAIIMTLQCYVPLPYFRADHPFVYILSEKRKNILFSGRLSNPNDS